MPPKKKKLTAEEQLLLDETRKEEEAVEVSEARKQQAAADEAARREPFGPHQKKIDKAVEECAGHLRTLGDNALAREAHRRLLRRIKEGLIKKV